MINGCPQQKLELESCFLSLCWERACAAGSMRGFTCRDQAWRRLCPVGLRAAGEGWDVKQGFPLLRHPRHLFFCCSSSFFPSVWTPLMCSQRGNLKWTENRGREEGRDCRLQPGWGRVHHAEIAGPKRGKSRLEIWRQRAGGSPCWGEVSCK